MPVCVINNAKWQVRAFRFCHDANSSLHTFSDTTAKTNQKTDTTRSEVPVRLIDLYSRHGMARRYNRNAICKMRVVHFTSAARLAPTRDILLFYNTICFHSTILGCKTQEIKTRSKITCFNHYLVTIHIATTYYNTLCIQ